MAVTELVPISFIDALLSVHMPDFQAWEGEDGTHEATMIRTGLGSLFSHLSPLRALWLQHQHVTLSLADWATDGEVSLQVEPDIRVHVTCTFQPEDYIPLRLTSRAGEMA